MRTSLPNSIYPKALLNFLGCLFALSGPLQGASLSTYKAGLSHLSYILHIPQGTSYRDTILEFLDTPSLSRLFRTRKLLEEVSPGQYGSRLAQQRLCSEQLRSFMPWLHVEEALRHLTPPRLNIEEARLTPLSAGEMPVYRPHGQGEYFRIHWEDKELQVYNPAGEVVLSITHFIGHLDGEHEQATIHSGAYSFDGRFLFVGSDEEIRIWGAQDGEYIKDIDVEEPVTAMASFPLSDFLYVGDASGCLTLYGITRECNEQGALIGLKVHTLTHIRLHQDEITYICIALDRNLLFTSSTDGNVAIVSLLTGALLGYLESHEPLTSVSVISGVPLILTSSENSHVTLWSLKTFQPLESYTFRDRVEYALVRQDSIEQQASEYALSFVLQAITRPEGKDELTLWSLPWKGAPFVKPWEGSPDYGELWAQKALPPITYKQLQQLFYLCQTGDWFRLREAYVQLKAS